ncbi:hypothetical protein G9A89_004906 [Geosiphon pyriformis]|nr:hypothetical protein G9A89_004906 [Geosiphon pyriformis]
MAKGKLVFKILLISTFLAYAFLFTCVDAFPKEKRCVSCSQTVRECPECGPGQYCKVIKGDCNHCSSATCERLAGDHPTNDSDGLICIQQIPQCPTCFHGEECVKSPKTANTCPTATCQKIRGKPGYDRPVRYNQKNELDTPTLEKRLICPAVVPKCPPCDEDQECVILRKPDACPKGICQKKNIKPPPETGPCKIPLNCFWAPKCQKNTCPEGQICQELPQTCKQCASTYCSTLA